jgi:hypothetical protein
VFNLCGAICVYVTLWLHFSSSVLSNIEAIFYFPPHDSEIHAKEK